MEQTAKSLRAQAIQSHQAEDLNAAMRLYAKVLRLTPDDAGVWSNLGVIHRKTKRFDMAIRAQERAVALAPDSIGNRNNLANVLMDVGRYDESIEHRKFILSQNPDLPQHMAMIGRSLRCKGDHQASVDYLEGVQQTYPDDTEIRMQLAFSQLGQGDYATGFENYKARWVNGELTPRKINLPEWQGEPLDGKTVLVMPEQGFGDAVLFARFIPMLQKMGAKVVCLTEKPLLDLFIDLDGVDVITPQATGAHGINCWVNMVDLAAYHFANGGTMPAPAKLHVTEASQARAKRITAPFQGRFKIGVIWTGSVTYKNNAMRSFSHRDFLPLVDMPNVQLFSLYKGPMLDPYYDDGSEAFIIDAGGDEQGFSDTAATMQQMDLIITSDTATAHIAGSLGLPTWTVLHWDPFWIWQHQGDKTDWYPSMRLFRQDIPMDWAGAHAKVKEALAIHLDNIK